MGNVLTVPTQNSEGSLFSIGNMVFQIALRGGGDSPTGGTLGILLGGFFYWGGIALLIFQGFCDAQINIPYLLNIS